MLGLPARAGKPSDEWGAPQMHRLVALGAGFIAVIGLPGSAFAADQAVPQRQRPQQQTQQAPAQQQANWSGTQVGGFNGASSVSNSFAEPGSNLFFSCLGGILCPASPLSDPETPFGFDKDKVSYTAGAFIGHRWQFSSIVLGVEGDVAWKRGETTASQTVSASATYVTTSIPFETASRTEAF